jgi:hypothetical protein
MVSLPQATPRRRAAGSPTGDPSRRIDPRVGLRGKMADPDAETPGRAGRAERHDLRQLRTLNDIIT